MAVTKDLYMILGVPPIASAEEVRKAYRQLSKKYHPDLNPDAKLYSDDKMKELVEAYNLLNDNEKRKEYSKQPQFQVRKTQKHGRRAVPTQSAPSKSTSYDREPSLLERILSPFMKQKDPEGNVVKVDYKESDVHFTLALTMSDNESFFDQARNEFKTALRFDPACLEALYNYALMCYKLGEFDDARVHFQKYLTMEKDDAQAKKMLSLLRDDY
ncbi:MAG: DnaJ domain-containing protein [Candidatus Eremiobacteraeota bacterium]|nr:DnaJ domain-containing protein [Candidatus Eremiobacteraeota bacterium]